MIFLADYPFRYIDLKHCICHVLRSVNTLPSLFCFFSQVSIYEGDKRDCRKFCTTGIDGAMTIWDFKVIFFYVNNLFFLCMFSHQHPLVFTSSEPRSFYPGSAHHVKTLYEWTKRGCELISPSCSPHNLSPSTRETQLVTYITDHLIECLKHWSDHCGCALSRSQLHTRNTKHIKLMCEITDIYFLFFFFWFALNED